MQAEPFLRGRASVAGCIILYNILNIYNSGKRNSIFILAARHSYLTLRQTFFMQDIFTAGHFYDRTFLRQDILTAGHSYA